MPNGQIDFDPLRELPRAGLLLVKGNVYLTWASSCDVAPYHGWIIAYDAHTLSQTAVFNTSPDAEESGIWQSDTAPAADADGNVFVATGNGKFDVVPAGGRDYGDSVLKLAFGGGKLELRDFFTPYNQQELNAQDADLGSGGPVLLPDQPGPHPHLLVVGGKAGALYVIDRDRMGKWQAGNEQCGSSASDWRRYLQCCRLLEQSCVYFRGSFCLKGFCPRAGQIVRSAGRAGNDAIHRSRRNANDIGQRIARRHYLGVAFERLAIARHRRGALRL